MLRNYFRPNRAPPDDASLAELTEILNGLEQLLNPHPKSTRQVAPVESESIVEHIDDEFDQQETISSASKTTKLQTPVPPSRNFLNMVGPSTYEIVVKAKMAVVNLKSTQQQSSRPPNLRHTTNNLYATLKELQAETQHFLQQASTAKFQQGVDDQEAKEHCETYDTWYRSYEASHSSKRRLRDLPVLRWIKSTADKTSTASQSTLTAVSSEGAAATAYTHPLPLADPTSNFEYGHPSCLGSSANTVVPTSVGDNSEKARKVLGLSSQPWVRDPLADPLPRVRPGLHHEGSLLEPNSERSSLEVETNMGETSSHQDGDAKSGVPSLPNSFGSRASSVLDLERNPVDGRTMTSIANSSGA
ncbi:hypothetical protein QFC24_002983 [Naganishia onofrii]|uniref:Uncharacterized protein n=1 Tax=Naganishia onofrii TaxID=1851511 RepID=A0ACC2XNM5_9TREE|nr:hypothetical protein QFC24_002983 [Naganishia onofrii]